MNGMNNLKIFKVTLDEIIETNQIEPSDVILVLNSKSKNLFVYRGKYSPPIDEFNSKKLYERIINRFLNPNIYLLKTLEIKPKDNLEVLQIKEKIVDQYPNLVKYEFFRKLKNILLLKSIRENIHQFKNYEKSAQWRTKLSNTTNLWRLSTFNVITLLIAVLIVFGRILYSLQNEAGTLIDNSGFVNIGLWNIWKENMIFILYVVGVLLLIVFFANLTFYLFPMKLPIKPDRFESEYSQKSNIIQTKLKSKKISEIRKPKLPEMPQKPKPKREVKTTTSPTATLSIDLKPKKSFKASKIEELENLNDEDLGIPPAPMKKAIKLDVDQKKIKELAKKETKDTKFILIECDICGHPPIQMPVPKKLIKNAKEPVVDVSYVHGDPQHVVVAQLDHDYQVRRRRASWVVFEKEI